MSDMQDYKSRLTDPLSRKAETFSYLPEMSKDELKQQIQYIVDKGWNPAVEHTEPEHAFDYYWYMWKLPMFGETNVDTIMNEIEACRKANPGNHIRLIGYDNYSQSQGANMLIYRGDM